MRVIKFRAKRSDNGEWLTGLAFDGMHSKGDGKWRMWSGDDWEAIDKGTVGQFTGLQDKNSIDIYEGDIIDDQFDCGQLHEILYDCKSAAFMKKRLEAIFGKLHVNTIAICTETICKGLVAGNIHDSPELLENNNER